MAPTPTLSTILDTASIGPSPARCFRSAGDRSRKSALTVSSSCMQIHAASIRDRSPFERIGRKVRCFIRSRYSQCDRDADKIVKEWLERYADEHARYHINESA